MSDALDIDVAVDGPAAKAVARRIAREASYQVEGLVQMLRRESQRNDDTFVHVTRATVERLEDLNGVMMEVLGIDEEDDSPGRELLDSLRGQVFGPAHSA